MPAEEPGALRVEVVYSPAADRVDRVELSLAPGATVGAALQSSGLLRRHPAIDAGQPMVGVWGRVVPLDRALCDGDRVEVYRRLLVDPKEARRLRDRQQRKGRRPAASGNRSQ